MHGEHHSFFLDSNIILYRMDKSAPEKRRIAHTLMGEALVQANGYISPQVVQECLNILTSKGKEPISLTDAKIFLDNVLLPLVKPLDLSLLYDTALATKEKYKFSFYDALIISAALQLGCHTLYTEDLQHGQKIEGLKIINPFLK